MGSITGGGLRSRKGGTHSPSLWTESEKGEGCPTRVVLARGSCAAGAELHSECLPVENGEHATEVGALALLWRV